MRIAVAQLDVGASEEHLRRRVHALLSACGEWSVDALVVPPQPALAALIESLERPARLAVISARLLAGAPDHDVLSVDEFVFRDPLVDRSRVIAARRDARFVVVHGAWEARDRRHFERSIAPVIVYDASVGSTVVFAEGRAFDLFAAGEQGLFVAELGPPLRGLAWAALLDLDAPRLAEYAAWNRPIVAALERGELDREAARARIDAATALLTRVDLLDWRRRECLRRMLIRLDELEPSELLAHLREVWVAGAESTLDDASIEQARARAPVWGWPPSPSFAWSSAAGLLATGTDQVRLWTRDWTLAASFEPAGWVTALAWAPDGERLVVAIRGSVVEVWSRAGERLARMHTIGDASSLAWTRAGRILAVDRDYAWCWADNGRPLAQPLQHASPWSALSPDGSRLAIPRAADVELIEFAERPREPARTLARLPAPVGATLIRGLSWSPDGAWLSYASVEQRCFIRLADLHVVRVDLHGSQRAGVAWSHDGTRVATVSESPPHVRILARDAFTQLAEFGEELPLALAWAPDDEALLFDGPEGTIVLERSSDGTPLGTIGERHG